MDNEPEKLDHILVNMSGLTAEFALVKYGSEHGLHSIRKYDCSSFATATDCFNAYARDININMKGRKCAIAVSAAVTSDVIKIMRGNWTFSVLGFSHMFGQKPIVINDTSALSWANFAGTQLTHQPLGLPGQMDFNKAGKYLTIQVMGGAGLSTLIITPDNQRIVVDSEHAHTGFYPSNDLEYRILQAMKLGKLQVSWEHILCISDNDPFWQKPEINLTRVEILDLKASILGAFAGDATLSQTAWNGLFLYGDCIQYLNTPERIAMFQKRFELKNSYRMNLQNTPRWLVKMEHRSLRGCAAMLAQLYP